MQPSSIPIWLRWIRFCTSIRWGYVGLVENEFAAGAADGVNLLVPSAVLTIWSSALVLLGMLLFYWTATYVFLRHNKPRYDLTV